MRRPVFTEPLVIIAISFVVSSARDPDRDTMKGRNTKFDRSYIRPKRDSLDAYPYRGRECEIPKGTNGASEKRIERVGNNQSE